MEGSISCASQLHSGKVFSFLKTTVNSKKLSGIRTKIIGLYMDLNLTATTKVLDQTSQLKTATKEILRQTTIRKEILPQVFPNDAGNSKKAIHFIELSTYKILLDF
ncbi:hypothetical protein SUGI_0597730 [Cryptomeria japonica]|nr:hypothetical protein SUGI_0597730 [Cryptomeria japonica]